MTSDPNDFPLRPHPRLVLTGERLEELKRDVTSDPFAARLLANLKQQAQVYRQQPPARYELEGRRLLGVSRRVLAQVMNLALVGRLTGQQEFIHAARDAMLAAAAFPDWNPSHFLDVAEMALALAVGYDWLFEELSPRDRETIETALLDKALRPSVEQDWFWIAGQNNWNPVCHAGMALAALAIAEREPRLARAIVDRAKANVGKVAGAYGPDGAYDEGPMYWDYGTSFLVLLCAAVESATGEPFDPGIPGLLPSAEYMMHVVGPTGNSYNYSDCRLNRSPTASLFWFARKLNRPALAALDRDMLTPGIDAASESARLLPLALIWHQPAAISSGQVLPRCFVGGGRSPVALMRTRWGDPNASFLAIKGGSPSTSHGHMDVGSFVFEADGVRWTLDLPMQSYHSLEAAGVNLWDGSPDGDRWTVFRNGADGHGILRFNNGPQAVDGMASLRPARSGPVVGKVVVDLATLYPRDVTSASRTATLNEDGSADIVDQWQAANADLVVSWQLLTAADVRVRDNGFDLQSNGKKLAVVLDAIDRPFTVSITPVSELLKPFDAPLPGVSRVTVRLQTAPGATGRLTVRLIPGSIYSEKDNA